MTTYGVYFEFDSNQSEQWAKATVAYLLHSLDHDISLLSVRSLDAPVHQLREGPPLPLKMDHPFFNGLPSIGEGDPDDVFEYPHIKALLDDLDKRKAQRDS